MINVNMKSHKKIIMNNLFCCTNVISYMLYVVTLKF